MVRSDNGLIFQSKRFRAACRDYRQTQEFLTPYTPEQNGMIERFFRSLNEECVWQHNFRSFIEARRQISGWIDWYDAERPQQALSYLSPAEFREKQGRKVAWFRGSTTAINRERRRSADRSSMRSETFSRTKRSPEKQRS